MKIIILLILSFFVSGCSVDYHLTIDENSRFFEDVLIKSETKEESDLLQKNKNYFELCAMCTNGVVCR